MWNRDQPGRWFFFRKFRAETGLGGHGCPYSAVRFLHKTLLSQRYKCKWKSSWSVENCWVIFHYFSFIYSLLSQYRHISLILLKKKNRSFCFLTSDLLWKSASSVHLILNFNGMKFIRQKEWQRGLKSIVRGWPLLIKIELYCVQLKLPALWWGREGDWRQGIPNLLLHTRHSWALQPPFSSSNHCP